MDKPPLVLYLPPIQFSKNRNAMDARRPLTIPAIVPTAKPMIQLRMRCLCFFLWVLFEELGAGAVVFVAFVSVPFVCEPEVEILAKLLLSEFLRVGNSPWMIGEES